MKENVKKERANDNIVKRVAKKKDNKKERRRIMRIKKTLFCKSRNKRKEGIKVERNKYVVKMII